MREHRAIFKVDIPTSSSHATGPALQTRTKVGGVVEIYNVNGKLVLQEYIAPWSQFKQMELSHLNKGIYFCKVRWQDSTGQVKVVIE